MSAVDTLRSIAESAGRKGLKPTLEEGKLVIVHPEYPLMIVIEGGDSKFVVELRVGESIEDNIEELLAEEIDPRAELEDALDLMLSVIDYAVKKLQAAGFEVEKKTREAVLDMYDALESFLEEE